LYAFTVSGHPKLKLRCTLYSQVITVRDFQAPHGLDLLVPARNAPVVLRHLQAELEASSRAVAMHYTLCLSLISKLKHRQGRPLMVCFEAPRPASKWFGRH